MSLRRKLALWLCPELEREQGLDSSAQVAIDGWPKLTPAMNENAEAAKRAADESAFRNTLVGELKTLNREIARLRSDWAVANS